MKKTFPKVIAAVAVVIGLAYSPLAQAAPSAMGILKSERNVCVQPAEGYASCHAHVVTNAANAEPLASVSYSSGLTPAQLTAVYGPFGTKAPLVAVVDAYAHPSAAADLAVYRNYFGLGTANLTQVNQNGGPISTVAANVGWGQEEMLDLEMVSAICPQCSILYVGANSASYSDLAAAVSRAKALGATVISNSYGGNEFRGEASLSAWNIPGVAVTVSSGDAGYGAQFPAASAGVIAVGGTSLTLNADGSRASETAWSGAGSGCSAYISKPAWQTDPACSKRAIADVAAVADPNTGVAVYDSYGSTGGANWYVFGGTSVAAPIIAGIIGSAGIPSNLANSYVSQNLYTNKSALFDVTSGSNGSCTSRRSTATAYLCTSGAGYDGPTGNGAPNKSLLPF